MKKHLLIEKANRYEVPDVDLTPENCTYQQKRGYWTINDTDEIFMLSARSSELTSKKCDRETGEDQKGE